MSGKVPTKVFVGNLSGETTKISLHRLFATYGEIVECDVIRNYGFVHFAEIEDAKVAVSNLNGCDFEGAQIKVELSHSKVRQKPGMGGKGDCYRCGKEGHWSKDCPKGPSRPPRGPRDNDSYSREPYARDPYGRPPYPRDPYARDPYARDPYTRDPYARDDYYRDPYADYYHDRYAPPPTDRYRPYADPYDRHSYPPRDPYYRERDAYKPYSRPAVPEYYRTERPASDSYYSDYTRPSSYATSPPKTNQSSATVARVPAPY